MHANEKSGLATVLLMSFCGAAAWAQATPDAGSIQRQIEQDLKTAPAQTTPAEPKAARALSPAREGDTTVSVERFAFEGNTLLSAEQLSATVTPYQGRQYSLDQLRQIADIVADAYRDAGWLVRVSLPRQQVSNGVVTLKIVEANFGKTIVQGQQSRVSPEMLSAMVQAAQPVGQPVQTQSIDRALLLLDGIPGLHVAGNLIEGEQPGQTDLLLGVADRAGVNGDVTWDNTGGLSTGSQRAQANLSVNSPLGLGDQLQLTGLKTQGSDFERLAWTAPVGATGWRAGVRATRLAYQLVGDFASLDARGTAYATGLDLSYPWLRSQGKNVTLSASYDAKRFDNNTLQSSTSHYDIDVWNVSLSANQNDDWLGGGVNYLTLGLNQGQVKLAGSANQGTDANGPATAGSFSKWRASFARLQAITPGLRAYVALSVQRANKNLDSSERLYLGGSGGVRAYPSSEGGGSEGELLSVELRQQLATHLTLTGFYDHGHVKAFKNNLWADGSGRLNSGTDPNDITLKGYGVSLAWIPQANTEVRATWARRVGSNPLASTSSGADSDGSRKLNRLWLGATYSF